MNPSQRDDALLDQLADRAGLLRQWEDVHAEQHQVPRETLEKLLRALGLPCASNEQISESLRQLEEDAFCREGSMVLADEGQEIVFRYRGPLGYRLQLEAGAGEQQGQAQRIDADTVRLPAVHCTGYHDLLMGETHLVLAVAPLRCPSVVQRDDSQGRSWGLIAQIYSLRRGAKNGRAAGASSPISTAQADLHGAGDYAVLASLASRAGARGATALAISPVHAMFSADPQRYSPYAPSSRLFLNAFYADPAQVLGQEFVHCVMARMSDTDEERHGDSSGLIEWPRVIEARLRLARAVFEQFSASPPGRLQHDFAAFEEKGGEALRSHCTYEALHAHHAKLLGASAGWQAWPECFHDAWGPAVRQFAQEHEDEVRFHGFLQWLAAEGLANAQRCARSAGMTVGLIADLAIGTDGGGSHAWTRRQDFLQGVSVGAPPDLIQSEGQDWGLTAFSPRALRDRAFAPFLETLRSALAHAGGVRIDHVLGLGRMWLVPSGESAKRGVYLRYPLQDMLRLVALEAHRHHAIVLGENLGTVPETFNQEIYAKGVLGTSVLWFEREAPPRVGFKPPSAWSGQEVATTTTHDLPTVRGWWEGRDLEWRSRLQPLSPQVVDQQLRERAQEKEELWQALRRAKVVGDRAPVPRQEQVPREAIISFVARTPSPLMLLPLEDLLDQREQPNFPGPVREQGPAHPNWRQRLPVSVDEIFEQPAVRRAIDALNSRREAG